MTWTELVLLGCPAVFSVSVKQPIQDKYVTRRQRSSCADERRIAEVSILQNE